MFLASDGQRQGVIDGSSGDRGLLEPDKTSQVHPPFRSGRHERVKALQGPASIAPSKIRTADR